MTNLESFLKQAKDKGATVERTRIRFPYDYDQNSGVAYIATLGDHKFYLYFREDGKCLQRQKEL